MNLKTLSEKLGLSQTTVSRALNGYPEVSQQTRERVLKAAREVNYSPNRFARSLATGKTGHIGLIYPVEHNLITPLFNEFLGGVTQQLVKSGMDLSIIPTTMENELETYRNIVATGRVDGLIVSSPLRKDPRIEYLSSTEMPFIVHGRTCDEDRGESNKHAPFSFLDVDNTGAFYKGTRLLADMGHKYIALLNGNMDFTFAFHRYQGYQQALENAGLPIEQKLIFSREDMTEINGYEMTCAALAIHPRPSAFISSSMILTLGMRRAIRDHNLVIGKDISVISYDDGLPYLESSKLNPALTTVYSSIRRAGYDITEHLHQIILTDRKYEVRKVLDVELIIRGSTRTY
ncbi:MAG: LacI family DNA-binding transcriptional regulator [Thiolinea sp.]